MSKDPKMLNQDRPFDRSASASLVISERAEGLARLAAMDNAVLAMKHLAMPPDVCGPAIPVAPARGPLRSFQPIELVPGSVGTARRTGHWERGEAQRRHAARIEDVFDRMDAAARAIHRAKGDGAGPYLAPFTPGQVATARRYRDLIERHEGSGIKGASLEAGRTGGGQGGEFIDAYTHEGEEIRRLQSSIPQGSALVIRRIRPSARGKRQRGIITFRAIVDMICLGDRTPSGVLKAHGWSKDKAKLDAIRTALAQALDQMQGYRHHRPQDMY